MGRLTMKKIYLVGLALIGVFGLSATSAFGVTTEWLVKQNQIAAGGSVATETIGELLLIHLPGGILSPEVKVLCSGIFDGFIYPGGQDRIEKLLSLTGVEITLANLLACTDDLTTCPTPLVAPEHLPWLTQLELMEPKPGEVVFLDLFVASGTTFPSYAVQCMGVFGEPEVECEGETSSIVELMAGSNTLLGSFHPAELETEGLEGKCGTTTNVALQEGEGELKAFVGGVEEELDVSEV
jgi:hypothetical protein